MCIHMSIANTNKIVSMKVTSVHTVPLWPLVNVGTGVDARCTAPCNKF